MISHAFLTTFKAILGSREPGKTLNSIGRADKTSVVDFFGLGVIFVNFSHQKRLILGTFWIQKRSKNMLENKAAFFYALGAPSGCLW